MQSFTLEDLVQYVYKETSPEKTAAIKEALETDWNLREKYEVILSGQKRLDAIELLSPRKKAVDNILKYAEKSIKQLAS